MAHVAAARNRQWLAAVPQSLSDRSGITGEPGVQAEMEGAFGADFSAVRVRTEVEASTATARLDPSRVRAGRDGKSARIFVEVASQADVELAIEDRLTKFDEHYTAKQLPEYAGDVNEQLEGKTMAFDWTANQARDASDGYRDAALTAARSDAAIKTADDTKAAVRKTAGEGALRKAVLEPIGAHLEGAVRTEQRRVGIFASGTVRETDTTWRLDGPSGVGTLSIAGETTGEGVTQELDDAVAAASHGKAQGKKILAFLMTLADGGAVNEVTLARFSAKADPVSWNYKNGGKLENRKWIKNKFRGAMRGHHEWVPSDQILDVLERARDASAAVKGAKWVLAQHLLRSPTSQIIFQPGDYDETVQAWETADAEALASMAETFTTANLKLQGHVGALYLSDPNNDKKPVQQTVGTADWHDQLREVATPSKHASPTDMVEALQDHVIGGGERTSVVWNGSLAMLPPKLEEMAHQVKATHVNAVGKQLAATLKQLADTQAANFERLVDMFEEVLDELE